MSPKPKRMNREEFFAKLSPLDAEQLRKALWNLYWRGSAPLRERIESELDPAEDHGRKSAANEPPDPDEVLADVTEFAELARSGAYIAGTAGSRAISGLESLRTGSSGCCHGESRKALTVRFRGHAFERAIACWREGSEACGGALGSSSGLRW